MDRSDEGGDPACWAHLFEEEFESVAAGPDSEPAPDEDVAAPPANQKRKVAPRNVNSVATDTCHNPGS